MISGKSQAVMEKLPERLGCFRDKSSAPMVSAQHMRAYQARVLKRTAACCQIDVFLTRNSLVSKKRTVVT
ncbi:MAG: hypothetical protein ACI8UP_003006, partial [Porticoccaceae bacterium]